MSIQERIKQIRLDSGLTQEQFSAVIGMKRANYAQLEIGKQLPSYDSLMLIVKNFHKSYQWLIEGKEPYPSDGENRGKNKGKVRGKVEVAEPGEKYTSDLTHKVLTVDTAGMKLIPIADIKAAAGAGYINHEPITEEDVLRLPAHMVKSGHHLCIRIKGTSMAPTLQDGGYVIIRLLERGEWLNMLNERVYVVVDNEGKTYLKRVKNRFSGESGGFIVLSSDSPDKMSHPTFNLHPEEIAFIWYVEWYFTAKMPNIHDQYYNRLSRLEDNYDLVADRLRAVEKKLGSK